MPATINVNFRTVVHKASNGVSIAFPDVCKTPTPGGPVPIPYPNIAMSTDTSQGSKNVKMDGNPIMLQGSVFSMSTGDEAGTAGGGVVSGKIKGKAEFIMYSFDVQVEGKNVPRLADMMVHNKGSPANTPPIPEIQPPMPPAICVDQAEQQQQGEDPCDAQFLSIENKTDKVTVSCEKRARTDSLNSEQQALLGTYDIIMECMADFENNFGVEAKNKVELVIKGNNEPDQSCKTDHLHGQVQLRPRSNVDSGDIPHGGVGGSFNLKLLAPSTHREDGRSQGWMAAFWNFNGFEKRIDVTIMGCGVREGDPPNKQLRGLIIVKPKQTWKLTLAIPAFKKISKKQEGSINVKGDRTSTRTSSSSTNFGRDGGSESTSTTFNDRKGTFSHSESISTTTGGLNESYSESFGLDDKGFYDSESETFSQGTAYFLGGPEESWGYSEHSREGTKLEVKKALKVNPQFTLTCNGHSLKVADRINSILNLATTIRDTWNNLQNWAPKVGWSASLDVAILEGSISGEWGYRVSQDQKHKRISHVEPYYTVGIDVTVFKVAVTVGFGVEIKVENWFSGKPLVELVVKLDGSITVESKLETKFTSGNHSQTPAKISATSKAEVKAVARAVLLSVRYEASVSIDGGFAIDGEFKCGFKQDPVVEAKIYTLPVEVKIVLSRPKKKDYRKTIPCLPKQDIYEGQFPSANPKKP